MSLYSASGLFLLLLLPLAGVGSPTLPAAQETPASAGGGGVGGCPSCSLPRLRQTPAAPSAESQLVEAVKEHILNMLHLNHRPHMSHPVPRAALLNALKNLHVGRVRADGEVDIEGLGPGQGEGGGGGLGGGDGETDRSRQALTEAERTSEIISFAEAGPTQDTVHFQIATENGADLTLVDQANIWLYLKLTNKTKHHNGNGQSKVTVRLYQAGQGQGQSLLVSEKQVDIKRSGWHTLPVSRSVQAMLGARERSLDLRLDCQSCREAGVSPVLAGQEEERETREEEEEEEGEREEEEAGDSHRPFLMLLVREAEEPRHRIRKRGLECDGKVNICCRKQFYVNFHDIGWSDWIIAPVGYYGNYCEGECPSHIAGTSGSSLSFHSAVINHYRIRGYSPFNSIRSCCVPTKLRAMSMLYYDDENNIVKKDIQNMIVEECGCS